METEKSKCESAYIQGLSDSISVLNEEKKASSSRMERDIIGSLIRKVESLKEEC